MESSKESKRKKDRNSDDDDRRREKKSKRARSRPRSRSPAEGRDKESRRKRRHSKSRSPYIPSKQNKQNDSKQPEIKSELPARKPKETDMLNTRTGGAYIPPARLRMMQAQITDKSSVAFQRLAWEALKKSIHGHINKINIGNIGIIIKELLKENIVRGRGLLCRSVIQAQAASPTFTNVYAALVSAVNSRFPNIGELLLKRLVIQFKRGFKRNDKAICISSASFIAHLVNQRVAHEILALELLTLLVESPTDDSVEVAIAFLKECGQKLTEVSSKGVNAIFEMLRNILHEGQLDKRVQYMIEVMFQVWKDGFKDHPALIEELELVPEEEQFTHLLMLDDATDSQDILNVFKFDDKYEENEAKYKTLCKEILGSDAESEEEGSGESGSEEESDEEEGEDTEQKGVTIIDNTETNLIALRRTIYLTINSSLDFEECAHKLMKMQLKPGQEVELCHMFLDCCAEQRTYEKFYGLLAQRFCNINRIYIGPFEEIFKDSYATAHRLDTNRLRNVSKFFAHLLFTDSISWEVLECVKLNEEDTTSSSRIYIKILFQELAEYMGLKKLNDRLKDPTLQDAFAGVFPRDNPKNTRFSINFFTSIGLGGLTDELREHLKQMPKNVPPPPAITLGSSSSSSSSSSSESSSSDSSSSESEEEETSKKKKDKNKSKKKKTNKSPEEPYEQKKDKTKWGHDGFYDTYGKDARRTERPQDTFDIPTERDIDRRKRKEDYRDRNDDRDVRNEDTSRNRTDYNGSKSRGKEREREGRYDRRDNERQDRDRRSDKRDDRDRCDERARKDDNRLNKDRNKDEKDSRDNHYDRSGDRDKADARERNEKDRYDERTRKDDKKSNKDKDNEKWNYRERNNEKRNDKDKPDDTDTNDKERYYDKRSNNDRDNEKRYDRDNFYGARDKLEIGERYYDYERSNKDKNNERDMRDRGDERNVSDRNNERKDDRVNDYNKTGERKKADGRDRNDRDTYDDKESTRDKNRDRAVERNKKREKNKNSRDSDDDESEKQDRRDENRKYKRDKENLLNEDEDKIVQPHGRYWDSYSHEKKREVDHPKERRRER